MAPDPYRPHPQVELHHGDALDALATLDDASVHAVVTDPPYGIGFMGTTWDTHTPREFQSWCQRWATECLRVLKPGGHLLAFGGTRTYHRLAAGVEDAGFEVRDSLHWIYVSGFPKGCNLGTAFDRERDDSAAIVRVITWLDQQRERAGLSRRAIDVHMGTSDMALWWTSRRRTRCQIPSPQQWERLRGLLGFGPDMDEEVLRLNGRKGAPGEWWHQRDVVGTKKCDSRPGVVDTGHGQRVQIVREVTTAASDDARRWEGWGTALKPAHEPVVLARKPFAGRRVTEVVRAHGTGAVNVDGCRVSGRWPANVLLGHGAGCAEFGCAAGCPVVELDRQGVGARSGGAKSVSGLSTSERVFPSFPLRYQPKAPSSERPEVGGVRHPTVKPVGLMRWLVRLVTPPGGVVVDPFVGSGSTLRAAVDEGLAAVGVEREGEFVRLAGARFGQDLALEEDQHRDRDREREGGGEPQPES